MIETLEMEFMRNALVAGLLAAAACGIVGALVVVNRIVFITGGIAHSAYGGIGLALFLGISPLLGAVGFSLAVAAVIAAIALKNKGRADAVIGVLWAAGMATGVILTDLTPGYNVDMMSFLFGSILAVLKSDLYLMAALDLMMAAAVFLLYKDLLAMSYDDEFAGLMGVPVKALYFILYLMVALCVVIVIRVVGLILVIAFFTIGPYIAERYTRSLKGMMALSTLLNVVFMLTGLWISYHLNLTSGAAIIAVATVVFFLFLAFETIRKRFRPPARSQGQG